MTPPKNSKQAAASGSPKKSKALSTASGEENKQLLPLEHVVVVGASAGGLSALRELFANAPLDKAAYIVVQHLSPDHASALPEILDRGSEMRIIKALDEAELKTNTVYVISPGVELDFDGRSLQVTELRKGEHSRYPVDLLFTSAAKAFGSMLAGIILSGTGNDGSNGVRAIKQAGGRTFAQDPDSATHASMPRSAIDTGCVDFCLSPEQIAVALGDLAEGILEETGLTADKPTPDANLMPLFALIKAEFGTDLTLYKTATMHRRIERRVGLKKHSSLSAYVKFVRSDKVELHALYRDMLINVTSFFRDTEPFINLKKHVFPEVVKGRGRWNHYACLGGRMRNR